MIRISKLDEVTYKLEDDGITTITPEGQLGLRKMLRRVERKQGIQLSAEEIGKIKEILDMEGSYELVKEK